MATILRKTDTRFMEKVRNFPRNLYRIDDRNSRIFKFLYAILEVGVGQIKGIQDLANQGQNSLANTSGSDLDDFFQIFGIKRDPKLSYSVNPYTANSLDNIKEYTAADSKFTVSISKMLQAIQKGGTPEGLRLMAEATCSYPVQVLESWHELSNYARLSTQNETIVLILLDTEELTLDEKNELKTRVINNLEMIRPVNCLITVEVVTPESNNAIINPGYAAAGSFMFLADGSNQYSELLCQEREIEINSFVVDASTFIADTEYSTLVGNLASDGDLDISIIVIETFDPRTPVFFALLSNGEESEIVLVYNRYLLDESNNRYLYEVARAQLGTDQIDWNNEDNVTVQVNITPEITIASESPIVFGPWIAIPLADSPDNYPLGKYENNVDKFDVSGNYLFEWSSQSEFEVWFTRQIQDVGGEIADGMYRLLVSNSSSINADSLISALNEPSPIIRPILMPQINE